jgi:hypothetical protein
MDLATYKQNAKQFAKRGSELAHSKLDEDAVLDIRSADRQRLKLLAYIRENLSHDAMARKHGVSNTAIDRVLSRRNWSHVD